MNPNLTLLEEVNAAQSWFPAKKCAPVWARIATLRETIQTLEGPEIAQPGDYICRGVKGELWPQKAETFLKKYVKTDEVVRKFRKYELKPEGAGVMAAKVEHDFQVKTSWGEQKGKPGDFLLKKASAADEPFPEDVWIVQAEIFEKTYTPSEK